MSRGQKKTGSRLEIDRHNLYARTEASVGAIVKRVLPKAHVRGNSWIARDPLRPKDHEDNLSIDLISGSWTNFHTGKHGRTVVSLVAYLAQIDSSEAETKVGKLLGLGADVIYNGT